MGNTLVSAGTLKMGIAYALPYTTNMTVNSPGTYDMGGVYQEIGALGGNGTLTDSGGAANFYFGANNASGTFSGILGGAALLVPCKVGTGTQVFNGGGSGGANTNTSTFWVMNGTLDLTGTGATVGALVNPIIDVRWNGTLLIDNSQGFVERVTPATTTLQMDGGTLHFIPAPGGSVETFKQLTVGNMFGGTILLEGGTGVSEAQRDHRVDAQQRRFGDVPDIAGRP